MSTAIYNMWGDRRYRSTFPSRSVSTVAQPGRPGILGRRSPDGGFLSKMIAAAGLAALSGACELGGAWADEKREVAPEVLLVRQPPADAAAAGFSPILRQPAAPPDGSEARPFPTLRAALQAAAPG